MVHPFSNRPEIANFIRQNRSSIHITKAGQLLSETFFTIMLVVLIASGVSSPIAQHFFVTTAHIWLAFYAPKPIRFYVVYILQYSTQNGKNVNRGFLFLYEKC